jgi:REDY-like protein HapK
VIVVFLNRLKKDVDHRDYERWVEEFDYPETKKMKSVDSYRVNRVEKLIRGSRVYDYVELIEINDESMYEKELRGPVGKGIISQWERFVESSDAFYCDSVGPLQRPSRRIRDKS